MNLYNIFSLNARSSVQGDAWLVFIILMASSVLSCKKFVAVDPPVNLLVESAVFNDDATANAAVAGIYSQMMGNAGNFAKGGSQSISLLTGLSSDELQSYSTSANTNQFYKNAIVPSNTIVQNTFWGEPYKYIFTANSIIEGLAKSSSVSTSVKQQLTGEAKFIRSFCNFYLVNFFGSVPLIKTTNYQVNANLGRTSTDEVFAAIVEDLKDAQQLLGNDYAVAKGQRIRPNKWVASALLARVYLYMHDWANSEVQSGSIIANSMYKLLPNLNDVFLANSSEAIWQLMPVLPTYNTINGNTFILTAPPSIVTLATPVLNAFENSDQRKIDWVGNFVSGASTWYFPFKYKIKSGSPVKEYEMVFRLAEQILIRAEARAQQGKLAEAVEDINLIRSRAKLNNYTGQLVKANVLNAIMQERQTELFTEWGHRWMDIKRWGTVDSVMRAVATIKGITWNSTAQLYPLPETEIGSNASLKQNPGY